MELLEKEGWGPSKGLQPAGLFPPSERNSPAGWRIFFSPVFLREVSQLCHAVNFIKWWSHFPWRTSPSPHARDGPGAGLWFDGTGACLDLLFPPPSALPCSPFSSWLINNGAVLNSQNLPQISYKKKVFSTGKNQCNCSSILLFDLSVVYSVNKEDWGLGAASQKPLLKRKLGYFAWLL